MAWTAEFKAHVIAMVDKEIAANMVARDRLLVLRSRLQSTAVTGQGEEGGIRRLMRMSAERRREEDNVVDEGTRGADPSLDEIDDGDDGIEVAIHNSLASSSSTIPHTSSSSSSSSSSTVAGVTKHDKK